MAQESFESVLERGEAEVVDRTEMDSIRAMEASHGGIRINHTGRLVGRMNGKTRSRGTKLHVVWESVYSGGDGGRRRAIADGNN